MHMEQYEHQAQIAREFLISNRFRRDNRCKKWETYKKTIDGVIHRVKFNRGHISYDWFDPNRGVRGSWRTIRTHHFLHIHSIADMQFIAPVEVTPEMQEDLDNNDYLYRLGVAA